MGERDALTAGEHVASPVVVNEAAPSSAPVAFGGGVASFGAVGALPTSPSMRAAIARQVVGGRSNGELQRLLRPRTEAAGVIQRSPISDEFREIWHTQGKG